MRMVHLPEVACEFAVSMARLELEIILKLFSETDNCSFCFIEMVAQTACLTLDLPSCWCKIFRHFIQCFLGWRSVATFSICVHGFVSMSQGCLYVLYDV